jgi:periplasmic copper chaperone A
MSICVRLRSRTALTTFFIVLSAAIGLPCAAHEFTISGLHINHPYTIEPVERLPRTLPVYMEIRNSGASDRLISVASEHAKSAALVSAARDGSTAGPIAAIEIPAGAKIVLGPAVAHIQLRDLTEPVEGYEYFTVTLTFEKAGRVEVEVCVEDRAETTLNH